MINKDIRFFYCKSFIWLFLFLFGCTPDKQENHNRIQLFYNEPASDWYAALPIGNGRMGAMIFGTPEIEHLQLNENTLYSGEPSTAFKDMQVTDAGLEKVVAYIKNGEYSDAEQYVKDHWMGSSDQAYQPLGDLYLDFSHDEVTDYKRSLDISESLVTVNYKHKGVNYTREYLASHPDQVIAMRFTSDKQESIDFKAYFGSIHPTIVQTSEGLTELILTGQAPGFLTNRTLEEIEEKNYQHKYPDIYDEKGNRKSFAKQVLYGDEADGKGMFFEARLKVITEGGQIEASDEGIKVSGADEVTLLLSEATSFNGYDKSPSREGKDPSISTKRDIEKASAKKYEEIKSAHTTDYTDLFSRVELNLGKKDNGNTLIVRDLFDQFKKSENPDLVKLMFQYGRYLMISGSRPGGQPLNLQGIWNQETLPPWNSNYTTNINVQMNYWPAEVTNLSECHEPMYRLVKELSESGKKTARGMYGRDGWLCHHNTTLWRDTETSDSNPMSGYWPMAAGWLVSHLWEHYLFTGDDEFLKNKTYPVLKGAAEFYADWLVDNGKRQLVTPVSISPETSFMVNGKKSVLSQGSTMDMSLIRETFARTIEASEKLGIDQEFSDVLNSKLSKLLPYKIGSFGQVQEWQYDHIERHPTHRHLSQLYGFHPGNQINAITTPELFKAVERTLERRGDEATGWSMGWKINMWARMMDGDHAYKILSNFLRYIEEPRESDRATGFYDAGLFPNLLSCTPVYQIDGNFGFTAGVAEMLLQSHAGDIFLLPALPSAWPEGVVKGLKARGGFETEICWSEGRIKRAIIKSNLGGICRVRSKWPIKVERVKSSNRQGKKLNPLFTFIDPGKPEIVNNADLNISERPETYVIEFETESGKSYTISAIEDTSVQNTKSYIVSTEEAFLEAMRKANPGDEIVIKNGVYKDWSLNVSLKGSKKLPIKIKSESPQGVIFSASKILNKPILNITGSNLILDGFSFNDIVFESFLFKLNGSKNVRITNCNFGKIQGDKSEKKMLRIEGNADGSRIDHCQFIQNDNVQTITIRVEENSFPVNTRIDHNEFRNLNMNEGGEGSETIQVSQTVRNYSYEKLTLKTIVEDNHFENIRGDAETISNKSNQNIYRRNTLINCNQLVLRGGHDCIVEDNVLINSNGPGIRIYGSGHTIRNNIIRNSSGDGIALCYGLGSGKKANTLRIAAIRNIIMDNVIENAGSNGMFLGEGKGTDYADHKHRKSWNTGHIQDIPPSENYITFNRIIKAKHKPIEVSGATDNKIVDNEFE
ncbi:glycoside hydrolase N-terminal domain-containing protein [Reichenbachiella sp. MALMAid0571]|uniref:glycosyl hydrolase family 95 catalytic domain-containing protein n=1 Tax=Reichenbachiella sp. MALMAid0571 TaxID=3143939 RepID=UPI0032E003E6